MVEATGFNSMESRSSSMSSPPYNISSKSTKLFKVIKVFLYTHLRSLNARHFGMAQATRLKNVTSHRGHLGWQYLPTKFLRKFTNRLKVINGGGGDTDRKAGDFKSLL
jgi:hypothetical protein